MIELDAEDRLAIAGLQSPRETSFVQLAIRETAILVPCAVIVWFAAVWGDVGAVLIGPGLYAAYKIHESVENLLRRRRLGEILIAFEEELMQAESPIETGLDGESPAPARGDAHDGAGADGASGCFARAAEESHCAARHFHAAAKSFRRGKVPRGSAHAFAALGHLDAARRESGVAAGMQAQIVERGR
jgi:hypothetical protein